MCMGVYICIHTYKIIWSLMPMIINLFDKFNQKNFILIKDIPKVKEGYSYIYLHNVVCYTNM